MNWFKIIFAVALSIILVVSTLTTLFGAGRIVNAVLETYVFKVENCRYDYARVPVPEKGDLGEQKEICEIDYNQAKRSIADGIGMVFVAAPLAWFMFQHTRKMMKETRS